MCDFASLQQHSSQLKLLHIPYPHCCSHILVDGHQIMTIFAPAYLACMPKHTTSCPAEAHFADTAAYATDSAHLAANHTSAVGSLHAY